MTNFAITGRVALPMNANTDEATAPTTAEKTLAEQFPAGMVKVARTGGKSALNWTGGLMGFGGGALAGISLLMGRGSQARSLMAPLVIGGGFAAVGGGLALTALLLKPESKIAIATGIPTRAKASEVAANFTDRQTKIVQDIGGSFAVIDQGPVRNSASRGGGDYSRGQDHYYGDGHFHGNHYVGDGHSHDSGYYDPYYPSYGDYYPAPSYPSYPNPSDRGTSRGDDYSPSYPSNPGGGTSRGDDYSPPAYDPPSYDPPSYDPPSYDPPSYDPPSYDSGNSSSNGNPSYDDF